MKKVICLFLTIALTITCMTAIAKEKESYDEMGEFQYMVPIYMELSEEDSEKVGNEETRLYKTTEIHSPIMAIMATNVHSTEITEQLDTEIKMEMFTNIYLDSYFDGNLTTDIKVKTKNNGNLIKAEVTGIIDDGTYVEICIARGKEDMLILMYANEMEINEKVRGWMFDKVALK